MASMVTGRSLRSLTTVTYVAEGERVIGLMGRLLAMFLIGFVAMCSVLISVESWGGLTEEEKKRHRFMWGSGTFVVGMVLAYFADVSF